MLRLCAIILVAGTLLMGADGQGKRNAGVSEWDNVLPQIADGDGWTTRIMLVNMDSSPAPFTLHFYSDNGSDWNVPLKGSATGPSPSFSGTIPVGGSLFLETEGTTPTLSQGWAHLSTQKWVSGMAVFKAIIPTNDAEAVVPFSSEVDVDFYLMFDNRNGYVTSLALVNPYSTGTASISVQFRNPDGTVILNDTIPLGPREHIAFSTTGRYPDTGGKNGVIEFKVSGGQVAASALGLLFAPGLRGTFSSIHTVSIDPYLFP